jgi:hypothetical protein
VKALTTSFPTPLTQMTPVIDLHFNRDVAEPMFVFTKVLGDLGDGGDEMDLIDVHGHAA